MAKKQTIDWDEKAINTFAQYAIDKKQGFEKEEPNVNISSMTQLLSDN